MTKEDLASNISVWMLTLIGVAVGTVGMAEQNPSPTQAATIAVMLLAIITVMIVTAVFARPETKENEVKN